MSLSAEIALWRSLTGASLPIRPVRARQGTGTFTYPQIYYHRFIILR
jgi:hypothetical protein